MKESDRHSATFRYHEPSGELPCLFIDVTGECWWIDGDGELFPWESEERPSYPHQVRKVALDIMKHPNDEEVQKAIDDSEVIG